MERLDKILSHAGFGTRRDVRRLLHTDEVLVNGTPVTDPSFHLDEKNDTITINGEPLLLEENVYLMMNKGAGFVCANKDGLHETVFSLLEDGYRTPYFESHLHLVGRLDIDTEGLLLFTTDGDLTHRLTSPKTRCEKKYFVRLAEGIEERERGAIEAALKKGVHVPPEGQESEFTALPAKIDWTQKADELYLTISEGKYHQVKRMFAALGGEVVFLKRVQIGALRLDESLSPCEYRKLGADEVALLNNLSE